MSANEVFHTSRITDGTPVWISLAAGDSQTSSLSGKLLISGAHLYHIVSVGIVGIHFSSAL